jgi:hypothetical protein
MTSIGPCARIAVIAFLWVAPAAAQQATVVKNAVTWKVDHPSRTITVKAKLRFYAAPRCGANRACPSPSPALIERIKKAIESYWNGHLFKCYKVVVIVDVASVANQAAVPLDAVDIAINVSPTFMGTKVKGRGSPNYLSDDPSDRVEVMRSPDDPSVWGASDADPVYAHEFGHILGLHDNYQPENSAFPQPGASEDLMFFSKHAVVSAEMITRVVRRSGQVDESQIRCPMTMDIAPVSVNAFLLTIENFQIHAYTCDYSPPSSDSRRWATPIRFRGTARYDGSHIDPEAILRGRFSWLRGTFSGGVDFVVVPATRSPMMIRVSPEVRVSAPLGWTEHQLLVAEGELDINETPAFVLFGSPVYPIFKHGASECPP